MIYEIIKGMIIIYEMCVIALLAVYLGEFLEKCEDRRKKRAERLIRRRKQEFADECKCAGHRMMYEDEKQVAAKNHKKQTIKYTGLFSGADIEAALSSHQ